ncbi:MAG: adenosylcobinamide-GDP ribazoletransferase [Parvularculales bacterium]
MTDWFFDIRTSLILFTRLPVTYYWKSRDNSFSLTKATRAFPVAGVIVGLLTGLIFCGLAAVGLPLLLAAVLAVAAQAIITGAMHEDALGDMMDSLGGRDKDHRLAILEDSRLGTFGVVAVILALLAKVALIASLAELTVPWAVLSALIAAGGLSRAAPVFMAFLMPSVHEDGLGADMGQPDKTGVFQAGGIALLTCLLLIPIGAALAGLILAMVAGGIIGSLAQQRFGGHTGDILGTTIGATEIAFLLGLCLASA